MTSHKAAVVVVGSLHYDIFVEGPHRPAAGETVTGHRWFPKFGGKGGNQAVAAAWTGVRSTMVSAVGADSFATFMLDALGKGGVATHHVARIDDVSTGMSVAIADASGDYGAVIVSGANLHIDAAQLETEGLWTDATHLILQNEVSETLNIAAARTARAHGVSVCLNAAPWREMGDELLSLIDILVVNALEAEALCGIVVANIEMARKAARTLACRFPCVVVTAGGDGVALAKAGFDIALPAEKVKLVSTHGAGDCFIGTFVAKLAQGAEVDVALIEANAAAARHVSRQRD